MKRVRKTFQCWNCNKTYTLSRIFTIDNEDSHAIQDEDGTLKLWVECPFCNADAIVDLDPNANALQEVYRNGAKPLPIRSLNLPDIIPTRKK